MNKPALYNAILGLVGIVLLAIGAGLLHSPGAGLAAGGLGLLFASGLGRGVK